MNAWACHGASFLLISRAGLVETITVGAEPLPEGPSSSPPTLRTPEGDEVPFQSLDFKFIVTVSVLIAE